MIWSSNKKKSLEIKKGFTLIELLITTSIFILMTGLIIAKYGSFDSGTLLTNLAYDMALSIRTAQTYGLSVKTSDPSSNSFNDAYGVSFDTSSASSQAQFIFFTDSDNNGIYSNPTEIISTYNLKRGALISSLCVGNGNDSCLNPEKRVDITFKRPYPEAIVRYCSSLSCTPSDSVSSYPYTQITIKSSDGSTRMISIRKNGQISVSY